MIYMPKWGLFFRNETKAVGALPSFEARLPVQKVTNGKPICFVIDLSSWLHDAGQRSVFQGQCFQTSEE